MQITPFGRIWEWRHSLWLLWILFPFGFLSPIGFFYISIRGRKIKWFYMSLVFGFVVFIYYTIDAYFEENSPAMDIATMIILIGWIVSLGLAFTARREYLQILAKRRLGDKKFAKFVETTQDKVLFSKLPKAKRSMIQKNKEPIKKLEGENSPPKLLQINKASASELRALPGIDSLLATSIIETKKRVKKFKSFNHLVQELKVQPHVLAKAQAYLTYTDSEYERLLEEEKIKTDPASHEIDDHNKHKEKDDEKNRGRIVDY